MVIQQVVIIFHIQRKYIFVAVFVDSLLMTTSFDNYHSKKINFGDELDAAQAEAKAWKTIWSAGQGVTSIEDCPSTKDLIDKLKKEFIDSIKNQVKVLEKFS